MAGARGLWWGHLWCGLGAAGPGVQGVGEADLSPTDGLSLSVPMCLLRLSPEGLGEQSMGSRRPVSVCPGHPIPAMSHKPRLPHL